MAIADWLAKPGGLILTPGLDARLLNQSVGLPTDVNMYLVPPRHETEVGKV